ncbi:hypothetical protein Pmani_016100 [Petrolisthes manimaculis]|uniref:Uncharacterized protein n=1 Tax=Petrolisthes manimaculis TaxID=1843537 RepID=A0AAE1PQA2_9EUCA|nr:hypothetical protein Pmani_016100 [Petrolisthes manimaculis]
METVHGVTRPKIRGDVKEARWRKTENITGRGKSISSHKGQRQGLRRQEGEQLEWLHGKARGNENGTNIRSRSEEGADRDSEEDGHNIRNRKGYR